MADVHAEIMAKVQEFASTWAIVDSRFDDGTAINRAEAIRTRIGYMLRDALAAQPPVSQPVQGDVCRAALQELNDQGWFRHIENLCKKESQNPELYAAVTQARAALAQQASGQDATCWCATCNPLPIRMVLCPNCGDKRCPKASNHRNQCAARDAFKGRG